ncbi:hypothetical protein NGRA_2134 [Nosema granulosis]|uniref:Uncharacterized protein n=1 Tax=Nosema granulosis TaxID=83296 RepID=A0A9P6KYG1_9MICR|nr:hypothetical protein NGRA_2134 [Nosema granulosis]
MEKYIFQKFTIENKILLSPDSMDILKKNIKNKTDIDEIVYKYKEVENSSTINIESLRNVIKKFYAHEEIINFKIIPWVYKREQPSGRYNFIKSKIDEPVRQIHELDQNEADIFGIIYKNKKNIFVIEDESGVIELDFGNVDCFIVDFVFLILRGRKEGEVFVVNEVKYPSWTQKDFKSTNSISNGTVSDFTKTILFFYGNFSGDINFENSEVFLMCPENKFVREEAKHRGINIVDIDEYSVGNPIFINVNNKNMVVYCNELFKSKEEGRFFGKQHIKSFIKTYISQYDINPFNKPHMYIETIPDAFIVFQKSYSCLETVQNVFFISVPQYRDDCIYLEYMAEVDLFVFKKIKK